MELIFWILIGAGIALMGILASIYTIVPADFADVAIRGEQIRIYSSHKEYSQDGKSTYFNIPSWFFLFKLGIQVHRIPLKIISINVPNFLAFDKDRARFVCDIVVYVLIKNPLEAAKRFGGNIQTLSEQISMIVQATTRDVTTKYLIREIINNREGISEAIVPALEKVIAHWGLELKDFELIDFKDPIKSEFGVESNVINNISSIVERQIESEARQKNAEQLKTARQKEAESEELAKKREIEKEEAIAKREQEKLMNVAEKQKEAREKELEVVKVQQVKSQEIEKERAIVQVNQEKEVQEINKEQMRLRGEGERAYLEEKAKGEAAPIREKGFAEAEAKDKLQEALNKFKDEAIRALVAEKIVEMQKEVGIACARALEKAEMKIFSGEGKQGFDFGQILEAMRISNPNLADAVMNRIEKPMNLGGIPLGKPEMNEEKKSDSEQKQAKR